MPYSDPAKQKTFQAGRYQRYKVHYRAKQKRQATAFNELIRRYKLEHPCVDCGEEDPIVLEFDHRPGFEKSFNIGEARNFNLTKVMAEMSKCDVRCANCHRRKTHQRRIAGGSSSG